MEKEYAKAVKFDVLIKWIKNSLEDDYISLCDLRKLVKVLDTEDVNE